MTGSLTPRMDRRLRIGRLVVVSAVLCVLALIAGAVFYWRLRQLDEALRPTTAKLENLQAEANVAQSKAHQLHEYMLPDELISALAQPNTFRVYRSVANIPDSVRSAFAKAADENSFLMADPNGRWEATDVIRDPQLPRRRLASAAVSEELCLLFYEHGGIGKNDNVAVFRISDDHAEPIWHAYVARDVGNPTALTKALQEKSYREAPFF
jgi:cell division protein FtsB